MRSTVVRHAIVPTLILAAIGVRVTADGARVHVAHRAVVVEVVALPTAPGVAVSVVAVAVVDTAVEADRWPPVAAVPPIHAIVEAPISGRPIEPDRGRLHPRSGHPIVAVNRIPRPIAGLPNRVRSGRHRLRVIRNRRRPNCHGDAERNLRPRWGSGRPNKQHAGDRQRAEDVNKASHRCVRTSLSSACSIPHNDARIQGDPKLIRPSFRVLRQAQDDE